jgi:hypothetical protein
MTGNDIRDSGNAPFLIDGDDSYPLKIYSESESGRQDSL